MLDSCLNPSSIPTSTWVARPSRRVETGATVGFIGVVLGPVVAAVLTGLVETYALAPEAEPEAVPPTASAG